MTDLHDLITRMADELDHYRQLLTDDRREVHALAMEARAALAEAEPEGPSAEEVEELCEEHCFSVEGYESIECLQGLINEAIARWGRPAPVPDGELRKEAAWLRNECSAENAEGNWISMSIDQALDLADLLEQRQAAPVPVPVSERPWERDGWCHPEERWAWFYNRRVGWRDAIPPESLKPPTLFPYTHSLPFNALPLPSGEVEA